MRQSKNSPTGNRESPSYVEKIEALSKISKAISSDLYLEDIL
ncbi:unnamed protein product, partial [marine sediment metagenome]